MYVLQYCSLGEAEDSIHTWNDKGIALDELEKYSEAIACFDEVIKLDPENSKAWINKGIALSSLERYEKLSHALTRQSGWTLNIQRHGITKALHYLD